MIISSIILTQRSGKLFVDKQNVYPIRPFIAILNKIFWSKITVPIQMIQKLLKILVIFNMSQFFGLEKNNYFYEFGRCLNTLSVPILTYIYYYGNDINETGR